MIRLSKHFVVNWQRRVGNYPTPEQVAGILSACITIQKGRYFTLADGSKFNTLSYFWHPDLDLVLSYDARSNKMVSVLSKDNLKTEPKRKFNRAEAKKRNNYTYMTMH